MDLSVFNKIVSSEQSARTFFLSFCWKNQQRYCPGCKGRDLKELAHGKCRCKQCGCVFDDFSQRFIHACGFDFRQWLWFLKLFALEVSNQELAMQLQVSYATVLKAKDILRRSILAQAIDAHTYYTLGVWPGPGSDKLPSLLPHPPVFGVMEINGYVICDVLPEMTPETLMHFKKNFHLRSTSIGHVLYTAPFQQYQLLVCCGKDFSSASNTVGVSDLPADSFPFWNYAKKQLKRLRGMAPDKFPLHIKEWELRYNQRGEQIVPVLAKALCGFVPLASREMQEDNSGTAQPRHPEPTKTTVPERLDGWH